MPTTPVYALRYPALADPADVPTDMGELATDVEAAIRKAGIIYGTTPPASPVDGDLWCLPADATNGVMWLFRYRAASPNANKWEFVGGPDLLSYPGNINANITSTTYAAISSAPSLTIPRVGIYQISFGGFIYATDNTTMRTAAISPSGAGVTAGDVYALQASVSSGSSFSDSSKRVPVSATAGTLTLQGKTSAQTPTFTNPWLSVTPLRVS